IYQIVNEAVTGSQFKLIEALTEEIARRLLDVYPGARIRITVRKPHLPVPGVLDYAEVEIIRGPLRKTIRSFE
ncbi:MAG: dihydroneopterin aldolase, partial [Candidatus Electryoneaceae bacterium]|nr:dihydroneopterin aldolase [Candidatus Electryoneaceae bacterium]